MWECWRPPEAASAVEWIPKHVKMPGELESPGRFNLDLMPHVRGVLEAIDDPMIRNIILPWAARNGKTITALSMLIYFACTAPRPMLFGSSTDDKGADCIKSQFYPMLVACDETFRQLQPSHKRGTKTILLERCRVRVGTSGSPSTLAGFPACYGHATEVSKWATNQSREADPVFLFMQRSKNYPFESKNIFESSPGLKGQCQITSLHESATTERRFRLVPCPKCGEFQRLKFGKKDEKGGIKWEKDSSGRSNSILAEETAYYECEHCGHHIDNAARFDMMRRGVWLAEGLKIDKHGKISGKKLVEGEASDVSFGPLSTLYSLMISGWGQIAKEWLSAVEGGAEAIRNFVNSTLAECWDPTPKSCEPDELVKRLCGDHPAWIVPEWARFCSFGVDVQDSGQTFVYVLQAWGLGGRGAEFGHGICESFADFRKILHHPWPHADGGPEMRALGGLIDSGDEAQVIYQLCREEPLLRPCKGMNVPFDTEYRVKKLDPSEQRNKHARAGVTLIEVNTYMTQAWIQRLIDGEKRAHDPEYKLSANSAFDFAFLEELLNEQKIYERNAKTRYEQVVWVKRNAGMPNDYRAATRYGKVYASLATRNGSLWHKLPGRPVPGQTPTKPQAAAQSHKFLERPGGWTALP